MENVIWIAMAVKTNSSHQGMLGYCLGIAHVLLGHCLGITGVLFGYARVCLGMLGYCSGITVARVTASTHIQKLQLSYEGVSEMSERPLKQSERVSQKKA